MQKNLKEGWVVIYGIEVSTPYVIDKGMLATYGFVFTTNHGVQIIRDARKEFLEERGKSVQSARFVFNVNYNGKIGQMLYQYK